MEERRLGKRASESIEEEKYSWRKIAFLQFCGVITTILLLFSVPSPSGSVALVLFPWASEADAVEMLQATDSEFVRFGNVPWVIVVKPRNEGLTFWINAHLSGAILIINPVFLADCTPQQARQIELRL